MQLGTSHALVRIDQSSFGSGVALFVRIAIVLGFNKNFLSDRRFVEKIVVGSLQCFGFVIL